MVFSATVAYMTMTDTDDRPVYCGLFWALTAFVAYMVACVAVAGWVARRVLFVWLWRLADDDAAKREVAPTVPGEGHDRTATP